MSEPVYVVAGTRSWSRRVFEERLAPLPGRWHFAARPGELGAARLAELGPRYVFLLHWSERVPEAIYGRYECIGFHMADLPFGRGGSPLQNLIARGHTATVLSALRLVGELDAGPVYLKEPLSLAGTAEHVLIRATELASAMIGRIIRERPAPRPQEGEAVVFRRRKPADSRIGRFDSLDALYDHIRMLDGEGYPPAFLEHEGLRLELRRAARYEGRIVCDVTITRTEPEEQR